MKRLVSHVKKHIHLYIFAALFVIYAFTNYKLIPIGNGEEFRLLRGKETLEHFLEGKFKEKLIQPRPNYFLYNLYPMILVFLNPNFYYEWFHLMNLLFSLFGFAAIYFLVFESTRSKKLALFSLLMLVVFPRFFGQLGFNPIDMPFMVFYLWSLLAILKFSKKNADHWSVLVMGVLFGITQGLRQLGFTLYVLLLALDVYECYKGKRFDMLDLGPLIKRKYLKYIYIFVIANFFMVITWPNFAVNFFKSYVWYLFIGSNFYLWDFGLLFMGKFLENFERPWFYLPLLQIITYPIYISALFLLVFKFFRKIFKNRVYFLLILALVINYILYFALDPVLYDGTRHFLFLIPIVVAISVTNLHFVLESVNKKRIKRIIFTALFLGMIPPALFTFREYPYQYAYFNSAAYLIGNPYRLFESDYANTKYKQASEWIRDVYLKDESQYSHSDPEHMLKVYACDNAYALDYFSHKKFLSITNKEKADLMVCDYRNLKQSGYSGNIIKQFYIKNTPILFILEI